MKSAVKPNSIPSFFNSPAFKYSLLKPSLGGSSLKVIKSVVFLVNALRFNPNLLSHNFASIPISNSLIISGFRLGFPRRVSVSFPDKLVPS